MERLIRPDTPRAILPTFSHTPPGGSRAAYDAVLPTRLGATPRADHTGWFAGRQNRTGHAPHQPVPLGPSTSRVARSPAGDHARAGRARGADPCDDPADQAHR